MTAMMDRWIAVEQESGGRGVPAYNCNEIGKAWTWMDIAGDGSGTSGIVS